MGAPSSVRGETVTAHAYTTVAEVRRIFSKPDTLDAVYESAIRAATEHIDSLCSRRFDLTVAGVKEYEVELDYLGGRHAEMTIDDIAVGGDTTPTVEQAAYPDDADLWETVDGGWWLGPRSPEYGWPYVEFVVRSPRSWQGFIRVTADFGWDAVPAPVQRACHRLAARIMNREDSVMGIQTSTEFGKAISFARPDPDTARLLRAYKKTDYLVSRWE